MKTKEIDNSELGWKKIKLDQNDDDHNSILSWWNWKLAMFGQSEWGINVIGYKYLWRLLSEELHISVC